METDPSALENSDQVVMSSSDEQGPSQATARSYECNFCKRGFSNAQALGGHMNIHRKDKAKLKQASNEAQRQQLVDHIPKSSTSSNLYPQALVAPNTNSIQPFKFVSRTDEEEKVLITKWPRISSSDDDDDHARLRDETRVGEPRKLPLFAETTSKTGDEKLVSARVGEGTKEGFSMSHGSTGPELLDLELRLGNEPPDSSAIKKFF